MTRETDRDPVPETVEQRLQALARDAAQTVPAEAAERLASMRRQAVAELDERAFDWSRWPGWRGRAVAVVAAAVVVMVTAWIYLRPATDAMVLPLVTEPEVAIVQDLELLEELEFLAWLEEESQGAG